jgi:hypothetical protein
MMSKDTKFQQVDWFRLRQLQSMQRIGDVCANAINIGDSYYQIGKDEYAMIESIRSLRLSEQDKLAVCFFWAPSFSAFQRMVTRPETSAVDDGLNAAMPEGLRLAPECVTCGKIAHYLEFHRNLRSNALDKYSKSYEIVGSYLAVERLTYYFRSKLPVPSDEMPYGVKLETSDFRWEKAGM